VLTVDRLCLLQHEQQKDQAQVQGGHLQQEQQQQQSRTQRANLASNVRKGQLL
jgi:hypothetical protein